MRKDDDFSLSTHSLRTVVYIRKEVLYGIVKKSVKIRKLFLYAFFTGSLGIRKFEISCCGSVSPSHSKFFLCDEKVAKLL